MFGMYFLAEIKTPRDGVWKSYPGSASNQTVSKSETSIAMDPTVVSCPPLHDEPIISFLP